MVTSLDMSSRLWPTAPWPVRVKALHRSALVVWRTPKSSGPAQILHYTVRASTGQVCYTTRHSCTIRGLPKGTPVSFEVRAVTRLAAGNGSTSRTIVVP
jgi:hypothetical protein